MKKTGIAKKGGRGSDYTKIFFVDLTVCYNVMISVKILPRRAILYLIGVRNDQKGLEMDQTGVKMESK